MLLEQPNLPATPLNQQTENFTFDGLVKTDQSALQLVIADTVRTEKFQEGRLWMSEWRIAKALYEAPVKQEYWRDTLVPRSANSFPLVSQHIRAILDQAMPALFPDNPPFGVEPNDSTPREVARGWEFVLAFQLREVKLKQQLRLVVKDSLVFGTGIGKWGWETFPKSRTVYRRKQDRLEIKNPIPGGPSRFLDTAESDEIESIDFTETVSRPFFHRCEINHVLVDPALRVPDIRAAAYVVYRDYLTIRDLNKLRGFEGYEIPSEDILRKLAEPPAEHAQSSHLEAEATAFPAQGHRPLPRYLDNTEDPLEHKLEVLEHWTADRVIVVLQRKLVIRCERNPFGAIPFVSCFWDDMPGTFYAFGVPRRIGGVQTHVQGLRNLRMDDIHMNLQKMWKVKKGTNIAAQPIKAYPGAVFKVDDMASFEPIQQNPVLQEAYNEDQYLLADAEKTTGANELMIQGAMPAQGRSSITRTATGASAFAGASSSRIQSFVEVAADQCLVPLLYAFLVMDKEFLKPSLIRKVVGQEKWNEMSKANNSSDLLIDMLNADVQFHMLAGSNMVARKNMSQALPLIMQMLAQPAAQQGLAQAGMKVDWIELFRRMEQATGWKAPNDIVVPMTPQDQQRQAMSNPAMVNAQATKQRLAQMHMQDSQLSAQEHQQAMSQIDQKGLADAGTQILVRAIERAAEREEMPELTGGFEGGLGEGEGE